jgi:hypothetical protein
LCPQFVDEERNVSAKVTQHSTQRGKEIGAFPLLILARARLATQNLSSKERNCAVMVERHHQLRKKLRKNPNFPNASMREEQERATRNTFHQRR